MPSHPPYSIKHLGIPVNANIIFHADPQGHIDFELHLPAVSLTFANSSFFGMGTLASHICCPFPAYPNDCMTAYKNGILKYFFGVPFGITFLHVND